jgi:uncharacterized protein
VLLSRLLLLFVAGLGYIGIHLFLFNRLNALGWNRRLIKTLEWPIILSATILPPLLCYQSLAALHGWLNGDLESLQLPATMQALQTIGLVSAAALFPSWLLARPIVGRNALPVHRKTTRIDCQKVAGKQLGATPKARFCSQIPGNQILQLSVEHKAVPVPGLPSTLAGLKVAHLSDMHLTGHVMRDYYEQVVGHTLAARPDLVALTGDLVDVDPCIDWLSDLLRPLADAPLGAYFVLGNHDRLVRDPGQIRRVMAAIGWHDLGGQSRSIIARGLPVELMGDERPWFGHAPTTPPQRGMLRILLSHSPDTIAWARHQRIHLMLAGHTHGGQGRLPWIGPILSPSWYGSRFASGEFWLPPTVLHVTRGLGGLHLLRWNCPPELAILTLQPAGPLTESTVQPALASL